MNQARKITTVMPNITGKLSINLRIKNTFKKERQ